MLLQVEGQGIGSGRSFRRPEPKDYITENVKRMRTIQREMRQKQEEGKKPMKALWKSTKYDQVQSTLKQEMEREPPPPRPHSASFLRAHSRSGFSPQSARPASTEPPVEKLTVPRAQSARELKLVRRDIDFVNLNGRSARQHTMRRSPSLDALDALKKKRDEDFEQYQRGQVPKYLKTRQQEWRSEEARRRAAMPDPDMPPGHRLMADGERKQTLQKLRNSQTELEGLIARLPITADTMRVRNRRAELERKYAEIEEAIKLFSRPKVFVKVDS